LENSAKSVTVEFEKAIALKPKHTNYYYNLGYAYKKQGDVAKEAYLNALELLPKDSPDRKKLEDELKTL